ncbi:MAG: chordopoxvirus fusion protein [Aquificota bacterium]|nr:MAG: chordopoxvirus fusion protein [Aquificota bacterium]
MLEVELLEAFEELPQELRPPLLKVVRAIQRVVGESVKRDDFLELKAVVGELAEAQRRTEERLGELAEAQKRTEERLDQLAQRVDELAEAQKRTEERLDQLAEAQRETERRLAELAHRMDQLTEAHAETRRRLESMSDAVGYELENKAYRYLPSLLERDFGIQIEGRLLRKYLPGTRKGRYIQVNIYGWGKKNGKRMLVLGEAKTSLSKREVNKFLKHVKLASSVEGVKDEDVLKVAVVHTVVPDVEAYAQEKGVKIYWSYDLM